MFSDIFYKIWDAGLIQIGIWETIYLTLIPTVIAYLLGIPLGVTIVVITHEMRVIDQICDRVAVIDQSRIAEEGPVSQVFTRPQSKIARELILPGSKSSVGAVTGRKVRLIFDGERSDEPVIANMILACQAHVSILAADTRDIDGAIYGYTVLAMPDDPRQYDQAIAWLDEHHNTYRLED